MTVGMVDKQLYQEGVPDDERISVILAAIKRVNFWSRIKGVLLAAAGLIVIVFGLAAFCGAVAFFRIGSKYLMAIAVGGLTLMGYGIYNMTHAKIIYSTSLKQ